MVSSNVLVLGKSIRTRRSINNRIFKKPICSENVCTENAVMMVASSLFWCNLSRSMYVSCCTRWVAAPVLLRNSQSVPIVFNNFLFLSNHHIIFYLSKHILLSELVTFIYSNVIYTWKFLLWAWNESHGMLKAKTYI